MDFLTRCILSVLIFTCLACSEDLPLSDRIDVFELETIGKTRYTIANGKSELGFQVVLKDKEGNYIPTENVVLKKDGGIVEEPIDIYKFKTTGPRLYQFQAELEGIRSNIIQVNARTQKEYKEIEFPVVFHIPENDLGDYPLDIFSNWIDILNERFNQLDHKRFPNSESANIRFRLIDKAPAGKELLTTGVSTYSRNGSGGVFGDWMWDYYWHPNDVINIWIGDFNEDLAGAATSPRLRPGEQSFNGITPTLTDTLDRLRGIILQSSYVKADPLSFVLLEHELGHFFGLSHLWPCSSDDKAEDTFQYSEEASMTCDQGLISPFNFLGRGGRIYDHYHFTYSQVERMRYVVDYGLWIGQNGATEIRSLNNELKTTSPPRIVSKPSKTRPAFFVH